MTCRVAILIFVLAASLVLASSARAQGPTATSAARVDLSASAGYLYDPHADFDIATVRRLARADFGAPDLLQGLASRNGATWVRLDVPHQVANGAWWLSVGPATARSVTLYGVDASGRPVARELGAATAFDQRPVHFRLPVFPLRIDSTSASRTLYLRVSGQGTAHVEPVLWRPGAFAGTVASESALRGAYFGVLALLLAFALFFWLELRSAAYLLYALYVASFFAMLWLFEGVGAQWLLPGSPEAAAYLTRAVAFVALGYTLWFGMKLVAAERSFPRLHRAAVAVSLLQACGAVAIGFANSGVVLQVALLAGLGWQPVFLALLVRQWRHRPDLRVAIIAFVPQMLGLVAVALRHFGVLPGGFWSSHALEIAGGAHMIVLALALMRRIRDSERRALALSRESEERLDRKVAERTSALADANRRLRSEVAERQAAQAELAGSLESERSMLRAQRDFVAMVSHEFRTPLAVIKTVAQRLRAHPLLGQPDLQQRLGRVDRATTRMTAMIETYLADDRMRAPERARRTTRFAAAALASAAAEHHGGPDSRVGLEVPEHGAVIEGDFALLTVALANLIDNGLKYSIPPAPVLVSAAREADAVRFRVVDHGGGIGESERERIFQRYVRGSASSGRGGAGLGLHLAREIARLHGGDIAIERTGAAGSVFTLTVPAARAADDAVPARAPAAPVQTGEA